MRENLLGTAVSLLVHACIILSVFIAGSVGIQKKQTVKTIEVNFSLVKDQVHEVLTTRVGGGAATTKPRTQKAVDNPGRATEKERNVGGKPEIVPSKEKIEPPTMTETVVSASDPQGETVVRGTMASYGDLSGPANHLSTQVGYPGGGEDGGGPGAVQGGGKGLALAGGSENYNFIRDAIMRNVRYPDRARRLGLEGRVVLSFVVLENGTTRDVKVVNSSGHRLLDESARDAAVETRVSRKVSHTVLVKLPITYKLQSSTGSSR